MPLQKVKRSCFGVRGFQREVFYIYVSYLPTKISQLVMLDMKKKKKSKIFQLRHAQGSKIICPLQNFKTLKYIASVITYCLLFSSESLRSQFFCPLFPFYRWSICLDSGEASALFSFSKFYSFTISQIPSFLFYDVILHHLSII